MTWIFRTSELFRELTPHPTGSGPTHKRLASLGGGPSGVGANRWTVGGPASLDSHLESISTVPCSTCWWAAQLHQDRTPISDQHRTTGIRIPTGPLTSHQAMGGSQCTIPPPAQHSAGAPGQTHFNSRGGRGGRHCRGGADIDCMAT